MSPLDLESVDGQSIELRSKSSFSTPFHRPVCFGGSSVEEGQRISDYGNMEQ